MAPSEGEGLDRHGALRAPRDDNHFEDPATARGLSAKSRKGSYGFFFDDVGGAASSIAM